MWVSGYIEIRDKKSHISIYTCKYSDAHLIYIFIIVILFLKNYRLCKQQQRLR